MVDVRDPLSNSEPKTAALDFAARRVGTIKAFEDVRKISFGDADAGIRHFNDGCAFVLSKRYLNAARLRRVLHGIVEQNPEHSLETGSVTEHRNSLLGANYKVTVIARRLASFRAISQASSTMYTRLMDSRAISSDSASVRKLMHFFQQFRGILRCDGDLLKGSAALCVRVGLPLGDLGDCAGERKRAARFV